VKRIILFAWLALTACAPTLEYQKAGAGEVKREKAIQQRMAAQIRQQRVKRLARVAKSLRAATGTYCAEYSDSKNGCYFPVKLATDDNLGAYTDGKNIYIHSGMLRFVESDAELAFILAHEISHNVLSHLSKKKGNALLGSALDILLIAATGVNTQGAFGKAGANAYSQGFEAEADYLGLYIAAEAGYDITSAPIFWRRMAIEHPSAIIARYDSTHPSTPERFVGLTSSVNEISDKLASGLVLVPNRGDHPERLRAEVPRASPGATGAVPRMALATESPKRDVVIGPQNYSIGKLARKASCVGVEGLDPPVSMISKQGPFEVYEAYCYGAATIRYTCEWQDCKAMVVE